MVTITLELPDDLKEQAQAMGLLTSEKLAEMIRTEMDPQRLVAFTAFEKKLKPVRDAFSNETAGMSDDDIQSMLDS